MLVPASLPLDPAGATVARAAQPPYAVPGSPVGQGRASFGVGRPAGPFVPAPWRTEAVQPNTPPSHHEASAAVSAVDVAVPVAIPDDATVVPGSVDVALDAATSVAVHEASLAVPVTIPPYRPLRPTPIVTPAIRTPLYIPPIPTPAAEAAVEDEGVIDPVLIDTAEFPLPSVLELFAAEPAETAEELATASPGTAPELPWIDTFLTVTPSVPMHTVPTPVTAMPSVPETEPIVFVSADPVEDAVAAALVVDPVAELPAAPVDEWPLDEVASELRYLEVKREPIAADVEAGRGSVDAVEGHPIEVNRSTPADPDADFPLAASEPMTPWTDDDLLDIMPIRHSGTTRLSNASNSSDGELWAERARRAHDDAQVFRAMAASQTPREWAASDRSEPAPEATAEEAAHALEVLARRVRAGELTLPSYDPRMGEPAALVAALAALLGVKLR